MLCASLYVHRGADNLSIDVPKGKISAGSLALDKTNTLWSLDKIKLSQTKQLTSGDGFLGSRPFGLRVISLRYQPLYQKAIQGVH